MDRIKLFKSLNESFDIEELQTLCFMMNIDYDNLDGRRKESKIRELITYLERIGRISELLVVVSGLRPQVNWTDSSTLLQSTISPEQLENLKLSEIITPQTPPATEEYLINCSCIQISIFQIFRMADLLSPPVGTSTEGDAYNHLLNLWAAIIEGKTSSMEPENSTFLNSITNWRRTINQGRSVSIGTLGRMKPIIGSQEKYDDFWRSAHTVTRTRSGTNLSFVPFELPLTDYLTQWKYNPVLLIDPESELDLDSLINTQLSGHLRIYPPGVGVVQLRIALTFNENTPINPIIEIIENLHELVFIDPQAVQLNESRLILQIIDEAVRGLGLPTDVERRWLPPATVLTILDNLHFDPTQNLEQLTLLLTSISDNMNWQSLNNKLSQEINTFWLKERVLALNVGKGALLCVAPIKANRLRMKKAKQRAIWTLDVYELMRSAAYAYRDFTEQIASIVFEDILSDNLFNESQGIHFQEFYVRIYVMRLIQRALLSVDNHLVTQPIGFLRRFGKEVWKDSNNVDLNQFRTHLETIASQIAQANNQNQEFQSLLHLLQSAQHIRPPFYTD